MAKQSVLGRGLENLIPVNSKGKTIESDSSGNLKEIKISEIVLNPTQPRKTFSEESIKELSETIKTHGVIQPIVVKKIENGYQLISGERRLKACNLAGFIKIPVVVKNYSDLEIMEAAIIENIQRENLNPVDEALAYQALIEKSSMKISDLAQRVGKNRTTISNLLRILQLPELVLKYIKEGKLTEGHARPLLSIGDKQKIERVAEEIFKKGMSVRSVEDYIFKLLEKGENKIKPRKNSEPSLLQAESKIRNKLSARVSMSHNEKTGKGKIIINYTSVDEFERILSNMGIRL
ncbi:MAG: ParB/RepB/Spo0J family partition protein [Leptospiraceae bacterium]|nr:ParB/RepB/Spo0J family partition protein [Leptospiraceae bacterium]MCK6379949.1 ParB/RepB/Spo0J family partition protein [Leptospiraceae bacterium]NUM40091.1 ParB/RepB/Spo0J family partition protein [Leptospiraceae bacterium]